jgi:hypothetical protein
MTAPLTTKAPHNDLQLLKTLLEYETINPIISNAAAKKFRNHLWYLCEDLVTFAVFDDDVPFQTKRLMVQAMQDKHGTNDPPKRVTVALELIKDKGLEHFTTKNSKALFSQFDLPSEFLDSEPEYWAEDHTFIDAARIIRGIKVVNDHAEWGIALIQEYNGLLTKDEPQFLYLLQVVEDHRRTFPDSRRKTLAGTGEINT